jgi:hypothetical protein
MLAKLGNLLVDENKINKYKKISFVLFLVGLFLFISFPLLSNRIFIIEKLIKNSQGLNNQLNFNFYQNSVKSYFDMISKNNNNDQNSYSNLSPKTINLDTLFQNIFNSPNNSEDIFTTEINSLRGDRTRFIMINLIFDNNNSTSASASSKFNSFPIYSLINHFSVKENYHWLAKDIQFNFIPKTLFYNKPEITIEKLTTGTWNKKIKEGQSCECILNFDLNQFDFENINHFLIKINGANSESVDMDYYKMMFDNLIQFFPEDRITTVSPVFSYFLKFYVLKNVLRNVGYWIQGLFPKENNNLIKYDDDFIYFLENIFNNYLLVGNKINTNHLLISKGFNSMLIKIINSKSKNNKSLSADATSTEIGKYNDKEFLNSKKYRDAFNFLLAMERIIKGISKNEIDLFRGEYHYLLSNSHSFVGVGFFLFIPVLCVLKVFYEILDRIYTVENKLYSTTLNSDTISASKIISSLLFSYTIQMIILLHIQNIQQFIEFSYSSTFYHLVFVIFIISFISFYKMSLNRHEEVLVENILRLVMALNCFNYLFVNNGLGLLVTVIILPVELLLILLNDRNKYSLQIILITVITLCLLLNQNFIEVMVLNFVNHMNNVYPLICIILMFLISRINIVIIKQINIRQRINEKLKTD